MKHDTSEFHETLKILGIPVLSRPVFDAVARATIATRLANWAFTEPEQQDALRRLAADIMGAISRDELLRAYDSDIPTEGVIEGSQL